MCWRFHRNFFSNISHLIFNSRFANRKLLLCLHQNIDPMKNHKGMRPHDIVVLLKIASLGENPWMMKDLANALYISPGEVSESLSRSSYAGLISANKRQLMKMAIMEFLQYGLKYVYPQLPGALVRGMPTAWAAPPLSEHIISEEQVVWPFAEGTVRGQAVEPLYAGIPRACLLDTRLYELLALTDALRIGKARERNMAVEELTKRLI
jgi:predicted transcriptional regulator